MRPSAASYQTTSWRPSRFAASTPVKNRTSSARSAPSPGILKPSSVSGRYATGTRNSSSSMRSSKTLKTRIVTPTGSQISSPATRKRRNRTYVLLLAARVLRGFLTSLAAGVSAFFVSLGAESVFAALSVLAESAGFELSPDSPLDSRLESPLAVSTRLRFLSPSPLKYVSYQPPPFSLNTGAEIRRRSVSLPHSGHLRSGESLSFCSASSSCEQLPQRYS